MVAEFRLEAFEQAERIRGGAGEPGHDLAVEELANLLRVVLHDDVAEGDLAVAADGGPGGRANGQNRGRAESRHGMFPGTDRTANGSSLATDMIPSFNEFTQGSPPLPRS